MRTVHCVNVFCAMCTCANLLVCNAHACKVMNVLFCSISRLLCLQAVSQWVRRRDDGLKAVL
jgi:hypothetical protein